MKKIHNTPKAPSPVGPYNQAVEANGMLFMSGQIAIHPPSGELILDSIENETRQVMQNIGEVLTNAGLDYNDIVKCSIFVKDMGNYSAINGVYATYFDEDTAPARELVEVARLPKDVNIEVSVIALMK